MKIEIPSNCPSCGSSLELVNSQLFCRSTSCPAQNSKLVENFCSKMKLKGFGPATIDKLELSTLSDLFNLDYKKLELVMGEKMASKLNQEIENKLKGELDFGQVLGSLGIPLIGDVAARKLALQFNSLNDVRADGKAGENLTIWKSSSIGKDVMSLPWNFSGVRENIVNPTTESLGISVCITGTLLDFKNRSDASSYLESLGYTVKKSVTKDVSILICEDESKRSSSSYLKAKSNGVEILTIEQLKNKTGK